MKTFTFRYVPHEPSPGKRLKDALKGKPDVRPHELLSTDLKALLEIATPSRLDLFRAIVSQKPNSIYELAELLQKSQPYVQKEVKILEGLGLIELVKELDGNRERLKPVALYSKIELSFQFGEEKEAS